MTSTVNDLVDAHDKSIEERNWIKSKLTDLEDRLRRNNLKLRGLPESVQNTELKKFATDLFNIYSQILLL